MKPETQTIKKQPYNRVSLRLTEAEWESISAKAIRSNKKNVKKFIIQKARELQSMNKHVVCPQKEKLIEREIYFPEPLAKFYDELSNCYGIQKSTLIFRLVILPLLITEH